MMMMMLAMTMCRAVIVYRLNRTQTKAHKSILIHPSVKERLRGGISASAGDA